MAEPESAMSSALEEDPFLGPADLNHPSTIQRRDTLSSKAGSEGALDKGDTCRICRSEGTPDEPLFYPCKCSGSIKFVHQECLMEWLSHSHKTHCELCKTPFRFTKLYDANMPQKLPWTVFIQRACWHVVQFFGTVGRAMLVALVWLGIIPWVIRWVWRWFFWVADAAWAREAFVNMMQARAEAPPQKQATLVEWMANTLQHFMRPNTLLEEFEGPLASTITHAIATGLGLGAENATSSTSFAWPQADPSILSSWTYVSSLTSNPRLNRVILDIFEGQIITCVVITGFILVFLIREWVVQQQPLVNLQDNVNEQLRVVAERMRVEQERLRQQHEIIERAQQLLMQLQNETGVFPDDDQAVFNGWEALRELIHQGNERLRSEDEGERAQFKTSAQQVRNQILAAQFSGVSMTEIDAKMYSYLAGCTFEENRQWRVAVTTAIRADQAAEGGQTATNTSLEGQADDQASAMLDPSRRPPMPAREFSSRATNIQRLLEDAEAVFNMRASDASTDDKSGDTDGNGHMEPNIEDGNARDLNEAPENVFWTKSDHMPITNAGPDAKVNIKRSGRLRRRAVPPPKTDEKIFIDVERRKQQQDKIARKLEEEIQRTSQATSDQATQMARPEQDAHSDNPFHPDGPEPEHGHGDSFSNRVASAFREEFGLDEAEELEHMRQAGVAPNEDAVEAAAEPDENRPEPVVEAQGFVQRVTDWFWADIQPRGVREPVPPPNEEIQDVGDHEAPFVPILDRRPPAFDPPAPNPPPQANPHHDPEVLAAAQQAGLDPEAIEDAEDLEGIFELIGFQGPLIGLFQTSAFASLLVVCTILLAVILPYLGGKIMLNIIGNPVYLLVKMPLQIASFAADIVIDVVLMLGGWLVMLLALGMDFLVSAVEVWMPSLARISIAEIVIGYATKTASNAGTRLSSLFLPLERADDAAVEFFSFSLGSLASSIHAHAALRTIQDEVNAVLSCMGTAVTFTVEAISTGSVAKLCKEALLAVTNRTNIRTAATMAFVSLQNRIQPFIESARGLRSGEVIVSRPIFNLDPSLVYWNSTDRALAIIVGYTALAALATIYVAFDRPITKSESGKKTEKMIRDTLRQAGGVLKVILIISIEMLVFPLYCGLLLDIAFLPLFQDATMASRWAFAGRSPYTFCFVHWFVGTCYMFHFALFVGMCRKILRKGVLWFIRDPDDPTFHPVRDVLERNVATQLRKIAFSALVYGALVILCLGGVIWTIGQVCEGIFPIYWISTEPILEFPMDLLLYNFITPLVIRLFRLSDTLNVMYAWWLRRCARMLRLSHFLFDDRRKDEEGHFVNGFWSSSLPTKPLEKDDKSDSTDIDPDEQTQPDDSFVPDGKYVFTPCNDQYRPPKPDEVFLHDDGSDVYMADKDGKRNEHWAKLYVPPFFRVRMTLFMICLWMFSAFTGLCVTLVPLVFGRMMLRWFMPSGAKINDIYAYSLGAYALSAIFLGTMKIGRQSAAHLKERAAKGDFHAWLVPAGRFTIRLFKCIYVYGFVVIVLPLIFALLLQFYFILPLHTAFVSTTDPSSLEQKIANATIPSILNDTAITTIPTQQTSLAQHTIHILQDYALGLLYVRIASRLVITAPASRAAEAFRRITAEGYLNPSVKLATRFFILPVTLLATLALFFPPVTAGVVIQALQAFGPAGWNLDATAATKVYRYSFPLASTCLVVGLTFAELVRATNRWRARIRDEVYLVGERLHNFGEKKPPPGSKSVVRREK